MLIVQFQKYRTQEDSKWLFTIRTEADLKTLLSVPVCCWCRRYPHFADKNFEFLRFRSFEIWPRAAVQELSRLKTELLLQHLQEARRQESSEDPCTKNFSPYSYQFYMCSPVKTFDCRIDLNEQNPERAITISTYIEPDRDRSKVPAEPMPISLATRTELATLARNSQKTCTQMQ